MTSESVAALDGQRLFEALCDLDERLRENAAGLPEREALDSIWSYLLLRIGELSVLAQLDEIGEVLNVPRDITPVPSTKEWVLGVANNRGVLLPIFDLHAFLFGSPTIENLKNRVLVVRRDEFPVGLLVGDVGGIRHFEEGPQAESASQSPDELAPYALGSLSLDTGPCSVFSARKLTQDARFNLTAA